MNHNKNAGVGIKADSTDGFQCTMGNCEDNCCRNISWSIFVDECTYEKYKKMNNELGRYILDCIEKTDGGLRKFKEFDHGHCPILTENGLCLIHRDLGEDFLCKTCTSYPRMWEEFAGNLEFWLSLSCPDAVRHVLYRKKRIKYTRFPIWTSEPIHSSALDDEKIRVREMLEKIFHNDKFSLKEKIIYGGLFMRSLGKNPADETINTYNENMHTSDYMKNIMSDVEGAQAENREIIIRLGITAADFVSVKIPEGIKNKMFYVLLAKFRDDIVGGTAENYIVDAFDRLIVPYVNENTYVFENYLVYTLMSSGFLKTQADYAKAYTGFAGMFLMLLAYTAGVFHKKEQLTHDDMTAAIYLFHRNISHAEDIQKKLAESFSGTMFPFLISALGKIL